MGHEATKKMTLMTAGYWHTTYWAEDFWHNDYWADYGAVIAEYLLLSLSQELPLNLSLTQELPLSLTLTQEVA